MTRKVIGATELLVLIKAELEQAGLGEVIENVKIFAAQEGNGQNWTITFEGGAPYDHRVVVAVIQKMASLYNLGSATIH